jgi:hypothetical protein
MNDLYELNNYMLTKNYISKKLMEKNYDIFSINKNKNKNKNNNDYKNKINFNNSNMKSSIINKIYENKNYDSDNDDINENYKNIEVSTNEDYFEPEFEDKLFWCFYIILNGQSKYELIKTSSFKEEKEFKIKSVENINNIKEQLKSYKLKLNEIKNELSNEKKITIKGLFALCILYKINIMYVNMNKGIYYNCFGNNINVDEITDSIENNNIKLFNLPFIIIENINKIFILNSSNENVNIYKNKYYYIENISKPVKAISNYTISEIQDLCNKLNIPIKTTDNKKINKQDLYNSILIKLE